MTWIDDVPEDQVPDVLADSVRNQKKHYGTVLNSTRKVAHTPHIALGQGEMSKAFSRTRHVSARHSHLLNLRVAGIVGCPQ